MMLVFFQDLLKDRATEIIKNGAAREVPYFLYLALPHVHWPVEAPLEFTDMYIYEKDDEQESTMECYLTWIQWLATL